MKTPILTYNKKRIDALESNILSQLTLIQDSAALCEPVKDNLSKLLYSLCYRLFTLSQVGYVDNQKYLVSDLCSPIVGIFRLEMINFVYDMIEAGSTGNVEKVLDNGMSYELLQMLFNQPTRLYAAILYQWAVATNSADVQDAAREVLQSGIRASTLEWEKLYLKFTERDEVKL